MSYATLCFRDAKSARIVNPIRARLCLWLIVAGCWGAATARTFAWSEPGHEIIASLAQTMISNTALAKVRAILATNDLASISVWADQARQLMKDHAHPGPLKGDPDAEQFIADHRDNDKWHFVNLPLNTFQYFYNGRFATSNDIVHTISTCIDVLENHSQSLTKPQALRCLIHFIGDIHQPLHVACGYYTTNTSGGAQLLRNPDDITNLESHDLGGNILLFVTGNTTNKLHAYWDSNLVRKVDPSAGNHHMMEILTNSIATNKHKWKGTGDYHNWPARWAKDAAKQSKKAYQGVKLGTARFNNKVEPKEIQITLAPDYDAKQTPRVTEQLAKGGYHLAELLNKIRWEN